MNLPSPIFLQIEFLTLILCSLVLPVGIYWFLYQRFSISRFAVIGLSVALIVVSGIDVVLLKTLEEMAKVTPSAVDDRLFASEISLALYLIPAVFAGIGVNLLSHLLIDHLHKAESRHDRAGRQTH